MATSGAADFLPDVCGSGSAGEIEIGQLPSSSWIMAADSAVTLLIDAGKPKRHGISDAFARRRAGMFQKISKPDADERGLAR